MSKNVRHSTQSCKQYFKAQNLRTPSTCTQSITRDSENLRTSSVLLELCYKDKLKDNFYIPLFIKWGNVCESQEVCNQVLEPQSAKTKHKICLSLFMLKCLFNFFFCTCITSRNLKLGAICFNFLIPWPPKATNYQYIQIISLLYIKVSSWQLNTFKKKGMRIPNFLKIGTLCRIVQIPVTTAVQTINQNSSIAINGKSTHEKILHGTAIC